jgi:hypothetical protein
MMKADLDEWPGMLLPLVAALKLAGGIQGVLALIMESVVASRSFGGIVLRVFDIGAYIAERRHGSALVFARGGTGGAGPIPFSPSSRTQDAWHGVLGLAIFST